MSTNNETTPALPALAECNALLRNLCAKAEHLAVKQSRNIATKRDVELRDAAYAEVVGAFAALSHDSHA